MTRLPRLLLVAALAGLALTVSAAPAAAKSPPCWSQVINDWYDNGRIDHNYSVACYQAALRHLPPDVQEYADAQDVIRNAMSNQVRRQSVSSSTNGKRGKNRKAVAPVNPQPRGPKGPNGVSNPGGDHPGLITRAFDRLGPGNANSIPIPLIVLGSLALLLLAAGAAGMVARKLQERRPQPATVPQRANDGPAV